MVGGCPVGAGSRHAWRSGDCTTEPRCRSRQPGEPTGLPPGAPPRRATRGTARPQLATPTGRGHRPARRATAFSRPPRSPCGTRRPTWPGCAPRARPPCNVGREMPSSSAMSRLDRPCVTSAATSRSRHVSASAPPAPRAAGTVADGSAPLRTAVRSLRQASRHPHGLGESVHDRRAHAFEAGPAVRSAGVEHGAGARVQRRHRVVGRVPDDHRAPRRHPETASAPRWRTMCSALLPPEGPVRPSTRRKCDSIPNSRTSGTSSSCPYMLRID